MFVSLWLLYMCLDQGFVAVALARAKTAQALALSTRATEIEKKISAEAAHQSALALA